MSHPVMVTAFPGGSQLTVRAQPRAHRSEIVGVQGKYLKVRLAAPPVDGAANLELRRLMSKALKVPASRIELFRGSSSREKILRIHGLDPLELRRLLGL